MRSETPAIPGFRPQMPRTIRSIRTPACDARYSAWITRGSVSAFILAMIRAGRPARASSASKSIHWTSRVARSNGDWIKLFSRRTLPRPVSWLNRPCTSSAIAWFPVIKPMSVYACAVREW